MKFRVATTVQKKLESSMRTIRVINYRCYRNESSFVAKDRKKETTLKQVYVNYSVSKRVKRS